MNKDFEVDILSIWDGIDWQTTRLADLKLRFLDLDPPDEQYGSSTKDYFILKDLETELQYLADTRFGNGEVRVECVRILRGSLEVLVTLTAVVSTAYFFFKDYKNIREGILLFVTDVKATAAELRAVAKKRLKNRKKDEDAKTQKSEHDHEGNA